MLRTGVSSLARSTRTAQNAVRVVSVRAASTLSRGRVFCPKAFLSGPSAASLPYINQVVTETIAKRTMATYPDHQVLTMPALSPTMEQGNIGSWDKQVGDKVSAGDVLCQVETDKATVSFDSTEDGYIAKILVPAGTQNVLVGTPIAIFVDDAESVAAFKDFTLGGSAAPATPAPSAPVEASAPKTCSSSYIPPTPIVAPTTATTTTTSTSGRVLASPAARILASERGVDISQVKGTATGNVIIKADVAEFTPIATPAPVTTAQAVQTVKAATAAPTPVTAATGDFVDEPTSQMRKVIAKRLTESKQNIPHYYITVEIQMDAINKLRSDLNKQLVEQAKKADTEPVKLSVNDFIIKATAAALRKVPAVNCSWQDTSIRNYNYVDISVAVSTDTGLITPIIADADLKGFAAISSEMKSLAKKARGNKLQPHEYQGGNFTISNLGMFGVKSFTAIINPPQAGILAVGASETKVVPNPKYTADNGEPQFKTTSVMAVTASFDHRVVDGAVGAQWLAAFREYCENPMKLLL